MLVRLHDPEEPVYVISVASRLLGVSPHFLRMLEREGILEPARTEKNIRLYSETELLFLRRVCRLIQEERVNIPGVKAILRLEMTEASFGTVRRKSSMDGPVSRREQDETEFEHRDPDGSTRKWR
jgi:MerR family transcriptional regulator/heat shock protein HspR